MSTDMTIALTVWGNRISPVFDSSKTLLVAKVCQGVVIKRTQTAFEPNVEKELGLILSRFRVDVLICGAITDVQSEFITKNGVRIVPFITGDVIEILDSYIRKPQRLNTYLMPGTDDKLSMNMH